MLKNKSYIGISFIILIFGIYAIPKIIDRMQNNEVVKGDRLDKVSNASKDNGSLNRNYQTLLGLNANYSDKHNKFTYFIKSNNLLNLNNFEQITQTSNNFVI